MPRTPKSHDRSQIYICTGENYRTGYPIGDVGDSKPLIAWLMHFYPDKAMGELMEFFVGMKNTDVVKYVYRQTGKQLEKGGKV